MFEALTGSIGIFFAGIVTLVLARKSRDIANYLLLGYFLRVVAVIVHTYIFPLPIGLGDAVTFEKIAWEVAKESNGSLLNYFNYYGDVLSEENPFKQHIHFVSVLTYIPLLSFFYVIFGRSPLLLNSLSITFGMLTIYFAWLIAKEVWNDRSAAKKSAFIIAFFPPLIMYSSVTLRAMIVVLFVQLFTLFYLRWNERGGSKNLLLSLMSASTHLLLHNPMFFVLMTSYVRFYFIYFKKNMARFIKGKLTSLFLLIFLLVFAGIMIILYNHQNFDVIRLPYLGQLSEFGPENIMAYTQSTNYGNAVYPSFLVVHSIKDLILLFPLRIIYFLYSPFLWDISSLKHILGIFDSLLYMYLSYLFFTRYDYIKSNKKLKIILFIFVVGVIVYSFGVGNFANAMRHRLKFLSLLVIIVAPFIFTKKLKNN